MLLFMVCVSIYMLVGLGVAGYNYIDTDRDMSQDPFGFLLYFIVHMTSWPMICVFQLGKMIRKNVK